MQAVRTDARTPCVFFVSGVGSRCRVQGWVGGVRGVSRPRAPARARPVVSEVSVCVCVCVGERNKEGERKTDRGTERKERERERERDTEREAERERQTDRQREREKEELERDLGADGEIERQRGRGQRAYLRADNSGKPSIALEPWVTEWDSRLSHRF